MNPIVARYMAGMPKATTGIVAKYMAALPSNVESSACTGESSGSDSDLVEHASTDVVFLLKAIEDFARGKPATNDLMTLMGAAAYVRYSVLRNGAKR